MYLHGVILSGTNTLITSRLILNGSSQSGSNHGCSPVLFTRYRLSARLLSSCDLSLFSVTVGIACHLVISVPCPLSTVDFIPQYIKSLLKGNIQEVRLTDTIISSSLKLHEILQGFKSILKDKQQS